MKKKISELELYQVDYLVAKTENLSFPFIHDDNCFIKNEMNWDILYSPTTNPSQAWPIIEREKIKLTYIKHVKEWCAEMINDVEEIIIYEHGKTSLESAMRCYCAYIYGEEVEI